MAVWAMTVGEATYTSNGVAKEGCHSSFSPPSTPAQKRAGYLFIAE